MKLQDIIRDTASRMGGVSVNVNTAFGTVAISDDTGKQEDIFMQGDDADRFIDELNKLWEETGDLGKDAIALHLAAPYVENLWN